MTLAGGLELQREPGTATEDGKDRSNGQRLMGSALMEVANGERDYDNSTEEGDGAYAKDLDTLNDALWGKSMAYKNVRTESERSEAMDLLDAQVAGGRPVAVGLRWEEGGHEVLVTGTETIDGQEYVDYINPWGREERMTREEFESRLLSINYEPKAPLKAPPGRDLPVAVHPPVPPPDGRELERPWCSCAADARAPQRRRGIDTVASSFTQTSRVARPLTTTWLNCPGQNWVRPWPTYREDVPLPVVKSTRDRVWSQNSQCPVSRDFQPRTSAECVGVPWKSPRGRSSAFAASATQA